MDIPLIVTDLDAFEIAKEFYPQFQTSYIPIAELTLEYLASNFDAIYQCGKFWALELLPLFELFYQKKMRIVFCPHGNSDKGHALDVTQITLSHDIALIYGNQMEDQLKKTGAADQIKSLIKTGNLRLEFYQKHKDHFDRLAQKKIFSHFEGVKPFILYAPTWNTEESPTSFFNSTSILIEELSPKYHLIIKPHPLLEETHPAHFHHLLSKYENKKELLFLTDFPSIYPLLERTDIYIGDYSSIGYDFLAYDRPLYFLNPRKKEKTLLHACGFSVEETKGIKAVLEKTTDQFSKIRKETYKYAFGTRPNLKKVRSIIEQRLYLKEE